MTTAGKNIFAIFLFIYFYSLALVHLVHIDEAGAPETFCLFEHCTLGATPASGGE